MKKLLTISLMFAAVAQMNAATIFLDLLGRSGAGMRFDNENPTSATGSGVGGEKGAGIFFDNVSNLLTINVGWGAAAGAGFANLTGTVTAAHIHAVTSGPNLTTNGAVIVSLDGATPGFNSSGTNGGWTNTTVTLTAPQATQLLAGQLYLNAHTAANTGGEIRGNLVVVPEPSIAGLLGLSGFGLLFRRRRA